MSKTVYRECTDLELVRARALAQCRLPAWSMTKRFARDLKEQVTNRGEITERQAAYLAVCCYRYRRQLPSELVPPEPPVGYMTPAQSNRHCEELRKYQAVMVGNAGTTRGEKQNVWAARELFD